MKRIVFFIVAMFIAGTISVNIFAQESANKMVWDSYDFIPGDVIIFEDNLDGERNGEFPSRWDLVDGLIENAEFEGENVIMFRKCNANGRGGIVPLMKNSSVDYLPDQFTIEFDAYFDIPQRVYRVLFYDGKNQVQLNTKLNGAKNKNDRIRVYQNSADFANGDRNYYPGFIAGSDEGKMSKPGWRRVSISFNTRALKVYLDDARLINIPNMDFNPCGITIAYHNTSGRDHTGFIKNIRIAEGAVPLYDKLLTDGKIVTSGIRFDVAKSSLKPESMGVINDIYNLMTKHPELKFSVEGHTDSDGNAESNLKLSQDRALTVMNQLISMGIDKNRLKYQGFGLTNPIADNSSAEGKAENRRVEFVKFE